MPIVVKSGNLSLLETSGPVRVCTGIALPSLNTEVRMIKIRGSKERMGKSDYDFRSHASECLGTNVSEKSSPKTLVYIHAYVSM